MLSWWLGVTFHNKHPATCSTHLRYASQNNQTKFSIVETSLV